LCDTLCNVTTIERYTKPSFCFTFVAA